MINLEREWNLATQGQTPKPGLKQAMLNTPLTNITTPAQADGFPLVAHAPEYLAPYMMADQSRAKYHQALAQLTQTWGPSSPNQVDFQALQDATALLVQGALQGRVDQVNQALKSFADPNTLVLVKVSDQTASQAAQYVPAPLAVAVAMHAQDVDRQMRAQNKNASKEHLTGFQEVVRALAGPNAHLDVGMDPSSQTRGTVVGYQVPSMIMGADLEYRHVPVTLAQSNMLTRFLPETLDRAPQAVSDGVAQGEALPASLEGTYLDLCDPARDSLSQALENFRANRLSQQASPRTFKR